MERDPAKRITAVATRKHDGEVQLVLLINGDNPLIIETDSLNEHQAIVLMDGYVEGLRSAVDFGEEMIGVFLDDPGAIEGLEMPLDMSPADRGLFKRGALGGLRLAAHGYWMDTADISGANTPH